MKTLTFLVLLLPALAFSQAFNTQPFEKAAESARKDNKILMVLLYAPVCMQCNEVADKGLSSVEVKNKLGQNEFIPVAYIKDQKDWSDLKQNLVCQLKIPACYFFPRRAISYTRPKDQPRLEGHI